MGQKKVLSCPRRVVHELHNLLTTINVTFNHRPTCEQVTLPRSPIYVSTSHIVVPVVTVTETGLEKNTAFSLQNQSFTMVDGNWSSMQCDQLVFAHCSVCEESNFCVCFQMNWKLLSEHQDKGVPSIQRKDTLTLILILD